MSRSPSPRRESGGRDRDREASRERSPRREEKDFDPDKIQYGTCKWFNNEKGFGFITPDDGGESIFVHQSQILARGFRSLAEEEKVEYKITQESDGRYKAVEVTGPDGANCKGQPRDDYGDRGGDRRGGRDRRGGDRDRGYGNRDRGSRGGRDRDRDYGGRREDRGRRDRDY